MIFLRLDLKKPLGHIGYKDGIFSGPFFGNIKTEDTARSPHVIQLHMKLRGKRMSGYAAIILYHSVKGGYFGNLIYADLYLPQETEGKRPAVFYIHGAGYAQGVYKRWSNRRLDYNKRLVRFFDRYLK